MTIKRNIYLKTVPIDNPKSVTSHPIMLSAGFDDFQGPAYSALVVLHA